MANKDKYESHVIQSFKFSMAKCYEKNNKFNLAKVTYEEANQAAGARADIQEKILEMNQKLGLDQAQRLFEEEKKAPRGYVGASRPVQGPSNYRPQGLVRLNSGDELFFNDVMERSPTKVQWPSGSGEHEKNTVESIMAANDFIDESHRERLEEGFKVKQMFMEMDRVVKDGSQWYFLPQDWLKKWERYTFFDLIMSDPATTQEGSADAADRDAPGEISYESILEQYEGEDQLRECSVQHSWQNHQLKENLCEGEDFMLVSQPIIEFLSNQYRIEGDGNYKHFQRIARKQDDDEVIVELRLRKIRLLAFPNRTKFEKDEPWFFYIPRSDTVKELEFKIKRLLPSYYLNVRRNGSLPMPSKFRLWKCMTNEIEKILSWDSQMANDSVTIDAVVCNILESDLKKKVEDLNFIDGTVFIIEEPKDNNSYTFRPNQAL